MTKLRHPRVQPIAPLLAAAARSGKQYRRPCQNAAQCALASRLPCDLRTASGSIPRLPLLYAASPDGCEYYQQLSSPALLWLGSGTLKEQPKELQPVACAVCAMGRVLRAAGTERTRPMRPAKPSMYNDPANPARMLLAMSGRTTCTSDDSLITRCGAGPLWLTS